MFRSIPCLNLKGFLENLTFHVMKGPYDEHGLPQTAATMEAMKEATERLKKKRREKKKQMSTGDGGAKGNRNVQASEWREEEDEEWVAELDLGVLLTLVSLPEGGNRLEKIRFRRDMFDVSEANRWWKENCGEVVNLYCSDHRPKPPSSQSDRECTGRSAREGSCTEYLSIGLSFSNSSGAARTGPERWFVEDQPGVFLIFRCLPDGGRELKRVLFSRERFGEVKARVWLVENKKRLLRKYTGAARPTSNVDLRWRFAEFRRLDEGDSH